MGNEQDYKKNGNSNPNYLNNPYQKNDYENYNNRKTKKCPFCGIVYLYNSQYNINSYNSHVDNCRRTKNRIQNINNNPSPLSLTLTNSENEFIKESKKELPRGKKDGTFEEKVDYLRYDISKKKIDFTDGGETLYISRENVLENSMVQLEVLNLFKEVKIIFTGEESSDAGGLIREWLTILFKEIMDPKTGLFERSDTDEVSYIIKQNISNTKENRDKYYFIGRVLAKALLENLTVNCCFNKVIYQLILGEKIEYKDLIFIDRPLYNSLKNLISMKEECADNIAFCEIYFSVQFEDERGNMCFQDLIENGNDILVTKDNFDLYIEKRIEYFTKAQLIGVKEIIRGINTIFSVDLLKIFTSDQLGLLINGTPFIDVDDWRLNTQYKNYNDYDNVIINFWEIISNLSQEDLSNFLLFCTGSSRVPIGGFKSLESNRGQISKFEIVKIDYIIGAKNFLRVHTCFNRLDLPEYPDKYSLEEAVRFALENQVLGYGIE